MPKFLIWYIHFSEDDTTNPMVAGFQDELDPEDIVANLAVTSIHDTQEVQSDQNSDADVKDRNDSFVLGMYVNNKT